MQDLLDIYINQHRGFTEEQEEDIYQTIGLFRSFNYTKHNDKITDLLMDSDNHDPDAIQDAFYGYLAEGLKYIIDRHGIALEDDGSLRIPLAVARTLLMIQKLDSYEFITRVIESDLSDVEKICRIMGEYSSIEESSFLAAVTEVREIALLTLADFVYGLEEDGKKGIPALSNIRNSLVKFKEIFGINAAIRLIIDSDLIMGEDFNLYLWIYEELKESIKDEAALNETLLFLLLYSRDGNASPVPTLEKYLDRVAIDFSDTSRLTNTIAAMHNRVRNQG